MLPIFEKVCSKLDKWKEEKADWIEEHGEALEVGCYVGLVGLIIAWNAAAACWDFGKLNGAMRTTAWLDSKGLPASKTIAEYEAEYDILFDK